MILSDLEIEQAIQTGEVKIKGTPQEIYIGPASIDLHLDSKAKILRKETPILNASFDNSKWFSEHNDWEEIIIYPREFYIMSTVEVIEFSSNMAGFLQGRSSLARLGINVHAAGFFDPGFSGVAVLEVTNMTSSPIVLKKNMRICQMVLVRTNTPSRTHYGIKKDSKYQNQSEPTLTKIQND